MSVPSGDPTVLIVDSLPLHNLGLIAVFNRLSGPGKFRFTSVTPDHAEKWIDAAANYSMIVYSVGGAFLSDTRHQKHLKALRARAADVPLVIYSDSSSREDIFSALGVGAQGFLHSGMDVEVAQQAVSFILNGGSYFPAVSPLKLRRPVPPTANVSSTATAGSKAPARSADVEDLKAVRESHAAVNDAGDAPSPCTGLTERQRSVLERLGHGESNKAIARRLGIREGTVKVHVRQIMRKLGVANRTQVAIISAVAATHVAATGEPNVKEKIELAAPSPNSANSAAPWPTNS